MSDRDSSLDMPQTPQPIALEGGRITSLDFIRGIAVMGILAANIISMGQPFTAHPYPAAFTTGHSPAEDWMWVAQFVLVDGKMRGLFTLLFGAGLYLFIEKAWSKGFDRRLQLRRLFWLALFGLVHFFLIWRGDILFAYAVAGVIATLFFIDLSPRLQMTFGLLGWLCGALFYGASMTFMYSAVDGGTTDDPMLESVRDEFVAAADADIADGVAETEIRQDGEYADLVAHTIEVHSADLLSILWDFPFETLPLMLVGMALYRYGFFSGEVGRGGLLKWGWSLALLGGLISTFIALAVKDGGFTYYGTYAAVIGWAMIPRLLLILGMTALFTAYAPTAGHWLGERISAAGRAAFTNYLGTSLVMLFVFGNWGLDLFGELRRGELYLVTFLAWGIMLLWSKPWLARFRYGPLEWLWRCLTYGRMFALRRSRNAEGQTAST